MVSKDMKTILARVELDLKSCAALMMDCDIIQPAEPFLKMAGEDLRRRIFLTQNVAGEALCLRPEFTIPVCMAHINAGEQAPQSYGYIGQVFRQRDVGVTEFYQAGIENLGDPEIAHTDARMISNASMLVRNSSQVDQIQIILGDQAVFADVLSALGLPTGWQDRLIHAFGDAQALATMLQTLSAPDQQSYPDEAVKTLTEADDHDGLSAHLADVMAKTGYSTKASRSPDDIARRMLEKQRLSNTKLGEEDLAKLKAFLDIKVPLAQAIETLTSFADRSKIDLSHSLKTFATRIEALEQSGFDMSSTVYETAFGRPLDYYTGLVFEIRNADSEQVLAAGGRYDKLMALLGAANSIPAVGFSLWLDRFEVKS
ncbi:MAG: ATP phosphoribosyltransferase regulatory subunit [Lentilitoribacter sp.]